MGRIADSSVEFAPQTPYYAYRLDVGNVGIDQAQRYWRARISTQTGKILGAGTMLDNEHVLTCAHVLAGRAQEPPTQAFVVELVMVPGCPGAEARVAEGLWVPVTDDERGDIAVLALQKPLADAIGAPLERLPVLLQQEVRVFGYPEDTGTGLWAHAVVVGDGGQGGELVQLRRNQGVAISPGFSGAGVIDFENGNIIGMVLGRRPGEQDSLTSWMMPVDAMIGYLPQLRDWVPGDPSVDESFVQQADSSPRSLPFAREFAAWLAGRGTSEVRLVITGESSSDKAAGLRLAVALADRERPRQNDRIFAAIPHDAVPRQGSIDLAVDASGKTAEEVKRRITERLGNLGRHGRSDDEGRHAIADGVRALAGRPRALWQRARTLVVDAIDDSAEPDSLVADVLQPLARRAADLGIRLVLGFRREDSPGVSSLRSVLDSEVRARLSRLDEQVRELTVLEASNAEHRAETDRRLTDVPPAPQSADLLAEAVAHLVGQHAAGELDWVSAKLGDCEDAVAQAVQDAEALSDQLDRMLAERDEVRALLELHWQRATDLGVAGDPALIEAYRAARTQLWKGRCNLTEAAATVDRFGAQVRARLGGGLHD